jgi:hypothetical protein
VYETIVDAPKATAHLARHGETKRWLTSGRSRMGCRALGRRGVGRAEKEKAARNGWRSTLAARYRPNRLHVFGLTRTGMGAESDSGGGLSDSASRRLFATYATAVA